MQTGRTPGLLEGAAAQTQVLARCVTTGSWRCPPALAGTDHVIASDPRTPHRAAELARLLV